MQLSGYYGIEMNFTSTSEITFLVFCLTNSAWSHVRAYNKDDAYNKDTFYRDKRSDS